MSNSSRSVIEQLKAELQHCTSIHDSLLDTVNSSSAAERKGHIPELKELLQNFQDKAEDEAQMLGQVHQELELLRRQLQERKSHKQGASDLRHYATGTSSMKTVLQLKERWSLAQQKLNTTVAKNKAVLAECNKYSKQALAAKQSLLRLQQQLADATAAGDLLQQQIAVVQQVQQQAAFLTEQLQLQNDAEELQLKEASKQMAVAVQLLQQQQEQRGLAHTHRAAGERYDDLSPEAAAACIQTIITLLQQAGLCCDGSSDVQQPSVGRDSCPESGQAQQLEHQCHLVMSEVKKLQEACKEIFRHCSLANSQLAMMHAARSDTVEGIS